MSEDRLQEEIVNYIRYKYPKTLMSAKMGGLRTSYKQAVKAKRTGYRKGQPDLFIYEAKRNTKGGLYHGLAIELKTIKGYATREQKEWIKELNERGWKAEICKGLPAALEVIDNYFNEKD